MSKTYVPYSDIAEAKRRIKIEMKRGNPDYFPKSTGTGWGKYKQLPYRHTYYDSDGRKVYDTSKVDLFFDWDGSDQEWKIDDTGLDIDGSK